MSDKFLPIYDLAIQTLSPLHIGSRNSLLPVQWFRKDGRLSVIDLDWLIDDVIQQGDPKRADLLTACLEKGIAISTETLGGRQLSDYCVYEIPYDWEPGIAPPDEIRTFIKQGGFGSYLPASSIKGGVRSALFRGAALTTRRAFSDVEQQFENYLEGLDERKKHRSFSQDFEAKYFASTGSDSRKYPNYDINRMLIARDRPFGLENLSAVQVKILSVMTDGGLKPKSTPIFIEALRAGIILTSQITWQAQLLREVPDQQLHFKSLMDLIAYLPQYCRSSSLYLIEQEIQFYGRHGQFQLRDWYESLYQQVIQLPENSFILPIGYGSGFDAKTITDIFQSQNFETVCERYRYTKGLGRPGNTESGRWLGPKDAPKSRKVVATNGEYIPLGWVRFSLNPAEGQPDWLGEWRSKLPAPNFWQPSFRSDQPEKRETTRLVQPVPPTPDKAKTTPSEQSTPSTPPIKPKGFQVFQELPHPGDQFFGIVLDQESTQVFLEIPELSPDEKAMAVLAGEHYPKKRLNLGSKIACEVLEVKPDPNQKNFWLVYCKVIVY